jgi:hypothetical protein
MEVTWIAGFFDGEGSAGRYRTGNGSRLVAKITQRDPDILTRIMEYYGYGAVYSKNTGKTCYDLIFTGANATRFLSSIEPYLMVKGEHIRSLL